MMSRSLHPGIYAWREISAELNYFGVTGLFIFGIAFGVVAFMTARKAEEQGVKATAGKVLGVLGLVSGSSS